MAQVAVVGRHAPLQPRLALQQGVRGKEQAGGRLGGQHVRSAGATAPPAHYQSSSLPPLPATPHQIPSHSPSPPAPLPAQQTPAWSACRQWWAPPRLWTLLGGQSGCKGRGRRELCEQAVSLHLLPLWPAAPVWEGNRQEGGHGSQGWQLTQKYDTLEQQECNAPASTRPRKLAASAPCLRCTEKWRLGRSNDMTHLQQGQGEGGWRGQ